MCIVMRVWGLAWVYVQVRRVCMCTGEVWVCVQVRVQVRCVCAGVCKVEVSACVYRLGVCGYVYRCMYR